MIRKWVWGFILLLFIGTADAKFGYLGVGPTATRINRADTDENHWYFGGSMRLKFLIIGLEAHAGYNSTVDDEGNKHTKLPMQLSGIVYPLPFLYAIGGIGWYDNKDIIKGVLKDGLGQDFKDDLKAMRDSRGTHLGVGLEFPIGRAASITGDVRYHYQNGDIQNIVNTENTDYSYYTVNVSLFFHY